MSSYRLRPAARADLAAIWRHTAAQWGTEQADRYLEDIIRQVEMVVNYPQIGGRAEGLDETYRKIRSGYHRVIYRNDGGEVIVVRVLHAKQDLPDDIAEE